MGLLPTAAARRRVHAYLLALRRQGEARQAALVAHLVGRRGARRALQSGVESFCGLPFSALTAEDFISATDSGLYSRTRSARLGEVDVFVSHSWHDSGEAKWAMLCRWAEHFEERHGREPLIWLDKGCINQQVCQEWDTTAVCGGERARPGHHGRGRRLTSKARGPCSVSHSRLDACGTRLTRHSASCQDTRSHDRRREAPAAKRCTREYGERETRGQYMCDAGHRRVAELAASLPCGLPRAACAGGRDVHAASVVRDGDAGLPPDGRVCRPRHRAAGAHPLGRALVQRL